MISTPIAIIAENGVVNGISDTATFLVPGSLGEASDFSGELRSVRVAEERRSVTAEVAVVIGLMADSIWEDA